MHLEASTLVTWEVAEVEARGRERGQHISSRGMRGDSSGRNGRANRRRNFSRLRGQKPRQQLPQRP